MPSIFQNDWWEEEDDALWGEIAELMLAMYLAGVDGGIETLPPNVRQLADFDRINHAAFDFAKRYRYDWIRGITDTTRLQTQAAVSDWIQSGAPLPALETALETIYGSARAKRIAQTESTRVFALGNQEAFESTGLVDEVVWQTAVDDLVCPTCGPLHNTHIGIGDIDAFPPAHINCRCYVLPVVSEDALDRQLEEIINA